MAEVLVLVEHASGNVKKVTLELLALAARVGEPAAVLFGDGAETAVPVLAQYGAAKVYVAEDPAFADYVVAPKAEVLAELITTVAPAAVLVASTAEGKEVAARAAIKTGSGIITDAVDLDADATATQSVFGGATVVKAKVTAGTPIITVRPNSAAPQASAGAGERVDVAVNISDAARGAKVVERVVQEKGARPELAEAAIVVAGGRGVASAEGFGVIESLADELGAAVGASRAATDAGWYPHTFQVGQTGKTVAPQLYIASGISGAIQHRAGMQTSKTVVVINKDPEAPLFEIADFGVVGDLFAVVPQLTEQIKARKG